MNEWIICKKHNLQSCQIHKEDPEKYIELKDYMEPEIHRQVNPVP